MKEAMDESKLAEQYIILLLGIKNEPIPSLMHLQKEMFLISLVKPKVKEVFNFEKHHYGPYSRLINEVIEDPPYLKDPFNFNDKRIFLSNVGVQEFRKLENEYKGNEQFKLLLSSLKLLRDLYDGLSFNELLFLIYETYPEYIQFSKVYDQLVKGAKSRQSICDGLLKKGLISEEKYSELLNNERQEQKA